VAHYTCKSQTQSPVYTLCSIMFCLSSVGVTGSLSTGRSVFQFRGRTGIRRTRHQWQYRLKSSGFFSNLFKNICAPTNFFFLCLRIHRWSNFYHARVSVIWSTILHFSVPTFICILPSKTQHMYINTVMKHQLHQGYMFRLWNSHHQANAEHIQGTIQMCILWDAISFTIKVKIIEHPIVQWKENQAKILTYFLFNVQLDAQLSKY